MIKGRLLTLDVPLKHNGRQTRSILQFISFYNPNIALIKSTKVRALNPKD